MRQTKYILPVLVSTRLLAQSDNNAPGKTEFGFSHGTFASISMSQRPLELISTDGRQRNTVNVTSTPVYQLAYGFSYGGFIQVKANDEVSVRPELDVAFSNYKQENMLQRQGIYATSIDISLANQVLVALRPADTHSTIRGAKCMSYYLKSRQPYLLIGPRINYKRFDKGFIRRGFQCQGSFGLLLGYGVNLGFHNMNFAPEIKYAIDVSSQNKIDGRSNFFHTLCFTFNMF